MAQDFTQGFYKTKAWQKCRASYAKSRQGLCEQCLKRGIYRPGEIVHHKIHITPETIHDPAVLMSYDNLELLCRDCHAAAHKQLKRWRIDGNGRVNTAPSRY